MQFISNNAKAIFASGVCGAAYGGFTGALLGLIVLGSTLDMGAALVGISYGILIASPIGFVAGSIGCIIRNPPSFMKGGYVTALSIVFYSAIMMYWKTNWIDGLIFGILTFVFTSVLGALLELDRAKETPTLPLMDWLDQRISNSERRLWSWPNRIGAITVIIAIWLSAIHGILSLFDRD